MSIEHTNSIAVLVDADNTEVYKIQAVLKEISAEATLSSTALMAIGENRFFPRGTPCSKTMLSRPYSSLTMFQGKMPPTWPWSLMQWIFFQRGVTTPLSLFPATATSRHWLLS